jgi:hypothetical protein
MKKIILLVVLVIVAAAGWYGYRLYHERNPDLTSEKADFSVNAVSLIAEFEKDTAAAGKKYTDRIIEVTGTIKKIDAEENPVIISLGDTTSMSTIQCSMDSSHAGGYKSIAPGTTLTLKGKCNGYDSEELIGTDVKINRCIVVANK